MPILLGIMLLMVLAGFAYLLIQTRADDRALLVYNAGQATAAAAELFVLKGTLSPSEVPQGLTSFGVYRPDGRPTFAYGEPPETLPSDMIGRTAARILPDGESVVTVRPLGGPGPMPGRFMGGPGFRGMMQGHGGAFHGEPGPLTLYAVYRSAGLFSAQRGRDSVLIGVMALFVLLAAASYLMYRRLRRYREREENQRHVLQLGEAARTLAHEIKNPLGAIKVQQAILQRSAPEGLRQSLAVIGEEVGRISSLTDRVREFLRDSAGDPRPVDLCALVRELAERQIFPVRAETPGEECTIWADRERIRSVVANLLNNAWESMRVDDDGGGKPRSKAVEAVVERGRKTVRLRVLDRGPGVPEGEAQRIFNPFFTTKEQGTGIGLAIVKRFVEAAGGTVTVRNRPEGGAEFLVEFPRGER